MAMKKMLWWIIFGTKGGINRARIIKELYDRPYNANQLATRLELDYKTVRHHLKVLLDNDVITTSGREKYGAMYFLSPYLEQHFDDFQEIWEQIGKKHR